MGKFIVDESTANTLVRVWEDETAQLSFEQLEVAKMPILDDATAQVRVVFDGVDDHMTGALPSPISTDDCTLIYVGKATLPESGVGVICSFYDADPANDFYYVRFGSIDGVPTCWYGNGVDTEVTLQATNFEFDPALDYELAFTADPVGGDRTFWIDGDAKDTSTTALSATVNNVQLGANGTTNYTVVEAGAVISYDAFKDASELSAIDTYLFDRYAFDLDEPTVGDSTVTIVETGSTYIDISWNQATDNVTPQNEIEYDIYYSELDNISTHEDALANGTLFNTVVGAGSETISQLNTSTTYYVNVFARDTKNNVLAYTRGTSTTLADDSAVFYRDFSEYADNTELQAEWQHNVVGVTLETSNPEAVYTNVALFTPPDNGKIIVPFMPFEDGSVGRKDELKSFMLFKGNVGDTRMGGMNIHSEIPVEDSIADLTGNGSHIRYGYDAGDARFNQSGVAINDSTGNFLRDPNISKTYPAGNWGAMYCEKFPENGNVRVRMKFWEPANLQDPEADIPASWDLDNTYDPDVDGIDNNPNNTIVGILVHSIADPRENRIGFYSVATGSENVLFKPPA